VNIHHNNVEGGEIRVDGGFGNQAPNNELTRVNIDHNIVWKPWWGCIMLSNVQGPTTIHGNTLGDSNQSGGTSSQDRANISIQYSNNVDVSDNTFNMLDTATGHNIWGLWSNHWVNGWVHGNSGVNNTANEWFSTQFGGNNTNINVYDNPIWPTVTRGRLDFTGDGTTTTKTITHGAKGILTNPQFISLVSNQNNNPLSVSTTTATTIDAKFATAPPASTSVSIYWSVGKTAF
jgi:hypothetical protein